VEHPFSSYVKGGEVGDIGIIAYIRRVAYRGSIT
jgi:hypothetical protein